MLFSQECCPVDVKKRAEVLYHNGFAGFQGPDGGGKDCFVICYFDSEALSKDLDEVRRESGCLSLAEDDWIGNDYLRVHWSEYAKITQVFNVLLKRGHTFSPRTKAETHFSPEDGDKHFSVTALEKKAIIQVKSLLGLGLIKLIDDAFCEEWNYVTTEGKAFARTLRENPLMWRYEKTRTNFYEWELFSHYNRETLVSEPVVVVIIDDHDDGLCVVCLDNKANTMVLPCEHCVVCKTCALGLEKTPSRDICVQCQRPIQHKLY